MRRVRLAVLGGTFDHLHVGHHALLATAFRVGREVAIGVTTDRYVHDHPKPDARAIQPYRVRRAGLRRWLARSFPDRTWRITPLGDGVGRSVDAEVGALIVSPETKAGGTAVNAARRRLKRPAVPVVEVPLVLADDLRPVSSRRVRAGEISSDGRRLAPIRIELEVGVPEDRGPAERAIRRVFRTARISIPRRSGGRCDLRISVQRRGRSGWVVSESSPDVRLPPRRLSGTRAAELTRGLVTVLRPRL